MNQRMVKAAERDTRLHLLLVIVVTLLACFPFLSQAAVFWDDEMEAGNTGYGLVGGAMSFDTAVKFSGNGSVRLDFPSVCYPDASAQENCGGYMDRTFTPTSSFYRRFYMRLSPGFTISDVFTKVMRSDTTGLTSNWWTLGCCGSTQLNVHDQNVPVGNTSVYYANFNFNRGQWYCVETYEQLNTPGVANGVQQAWVDGVQVLSQSGIMYRAAGDNSLYNNNRLYRQTGTGSIWYDRVAVGDSRIGCAGTPPPSDTTPPAIPSGLTAH